MSALDDYRRTFVEYTDIEGDEHEMVLKEKADAAVAELEAKLRNRTGPLNDSQCDRCQLAASERADKAEAEVAKLRWQRDYVIDIAEEYGGCDFTGPDVKSLDDQWAERGPDDESPKPCKNPPPLHVNHCRHRSQPAERGAGS